MSKQGEKIIMAYETEYICCEAIDCRNNEDYRCCKQTIHIDANGLCKDFISVNEK
jgi:hypothetical protein